MLLSTKIGDDDIFKMIGDVQAFPFVDDSIVMTESLLMKYGDRKLFSKMEAVENERLARLLVVNFGAKWEKLIEVDNLDLDIGSGSIQTIDEKADHREGRKNTHETTNKTGAYNSPDLVVDSGVDGVVSDDLEGDSNKTTSIKFTSIENVYKNLSLLEKNSIIDVILQDVSSFLTLDIY